MMTKWTGICHFLFLSGGINQIIYKYSWWWDYRKNENSSSGYVGFGTKNPKSKVEIADGDIYISTINNGVIMTSPDGKCWRGTINNSGVLEFSAVECPN